MKASGAAGQKKNNEIRNRRQTGSVFLLLLFFLLFFTDLGFDIEETSESIAFVTMLDGTKYKHNNNMESFQ